MANHKKLMDRRNKDDEATAHAFQEFIDTFQNTAPQGKTFIKSGVYNPGSSEETNDGKGKLYKPLPLIKPTQEANKKAIECARLLKESKFERSKSASKPKSNLDSLKEELRLRHMDRDERHKQKKCETVVFPEMADNTTNLFLTNLNPKLKEHDLMQIFGVYGPLASVKIMWPRAEERARNCNIGFVAFMSRKDSENAFTNLGNREDMRVSWGKPVEIPSQPIYIPPELHKLRLPPPYTGLPFNAQPNNRNFKFPTNEEEMNAILYDSTVKVTIPLDKKILMLIHRVVEFVIRDGPMFEAIIMHKEINNPSFQFLFDNKSATHIYYRWKLFSLMNGESNMNWSPKPFRMFKGGSIWIPPIIPDYTKGMERKAPKHEFQSLSDNQQCRLIQCLKNLTPCRQNIADALVFCMKHSEASKDVVNIICESLENPETLATKKIARLYLISDIIYNTKFKKPPQGAFQELFQNKLITVFEHLEMTYRSLGVSDKNAFRVRVLKVLRAWEMWRVYSSEFLDRLEFIFLGENCDDSSTDEPLDGKRLLTRSLNYNPECAVIPDVIKVQPHVETVQAEEDISANFIQSKWETLDPAEIESQAMSTKKLFDIEMARIETEKREKERGLEYDLLRKVELKVVKYQDDLEAGKRKVRGNKSIEDEVIDYRKKCIEKARSEVKVIETSPISADSMSSDDSKKMKRRKKRLRKKQNKSKNYKK